MRCLEIEIPYIVSNILLLMHKFFEFFYRRFDNSFTYSLGIISYCYKVLCKNVTALCFEIFVPSYKYRGTHCHIICGIYYKMFTVDFKRVFLLQIVFVYPSKVLPL